MKYLVISTIIVIAMSTPVMADNLSCSIRPAKTAADADLPGLAKITKKEAQSAALRSVKARSKKILDGELEAEHGCLIYSFDIRISRRAGVDEVMVDAGNGKVISHTHENSKQESAEQAQDLKLKKP